MKKILLILLMASLLVVIRGYAQVNFSDVNQFDVKAATQALQKLPSKDAGIEALIRTVRRLEALQEEAKVCVDKSKANLKIIDDIVKVNSIDKEVQKKCRITNTCSKKSKSL